MNKVFSLIKKELNGYFTSPVAYLILIASISLFNTLFFLVIDSNREVSLRDIFYVMEFMFICLIPLLTMGLIAEEKSKGTMEFLLTSPLTPEMIVWGKYLSILIFYSLLISFTGIYYVVVEYFGDPDPYSILLGYLGIWLEGALFIAVGLLASSWTRNQIIAAFTTYFMLFTLYFSANLAPYTSGTSETLLRYLSTHTHLENFAIGVITLPDIIYYIAGTFLCLVLTRISIDHRLWQ